MIYVNDDIQEKNLRLMQLMDQQSRTAQQAKMNALKRAMLFRNLGDPTKAAEELNKAQGKGFMSRWFGNTDLGGFLFGQYNRPEDFLVEGAGKDPGKLTGDEGKRVAIAAAMNEMQNQGGFGTGLEREMKTGWGPKAAALVNSRDDLVQTEAGRGKLGIGYTDQIDMSRKNQYSQQELNEAVQKHTDIAAYQEAKAGLDPRAEKQYDRFLGDYQRALASGNPRNARLMYERLVTKWGELDNKFGWDMSQKIGRIAAPISGGTRGGGVKKDYYYNFKKGLRREDPIYDKSGNLADGWQKMTPAVEQAKLKEWREVIANKDGIYSREDVETAQAMMDKFQFGNEGAQDKQLERDVRSAIIADAFQKLNPFAPRGDAGANPRMTKIPKENLTVGKVYIDPNGKKAKYLGNGKWQPI